MQTISRLPSLSIPSSAEAASTIIGGSFFMQLYSILQTNMLQRVKPPKIDTHPQTKENTHTSNNLKWRARALLMPYTCTLLQEQILNAMKQLGGFDMISPGVASMASPCIPSTSRSLSPSASLSVDRSMVSLIFFLDCAWSFQLWILKCYKTK